MDRHRPPCPDSRLATCPRFWHRLIPMPRAPRHPSLWFARARGFLGLTVGLALQTQAASPFASPKLEHSLRTWRLEDGLPWEGISCLLQTQDDYLWIGTDEGAIRFDGIRFELFDARNTPAFQIHRISQFSEDGSGRLWIATAGGGLVMKDGPNFRHFGPADGLANGQIRSVHAGASGKVWAATDGGGLYMGTFGKFSPVPIPTPRAQFLNGVLEAPDGSVVISTSDAGVWRQRAGTWVQLQPPEPGTHPTFNTMCRGTSGDVWVASDRGLWKAEGDRLLPLPGSREIMAENLNAALEASPGNWWLGSLTELIHHHPGGTQRLQVGAGFSTRGLATLLRDREGSIWAAADGVGLAQLKQTRFIGLGKAEGLTHDEVTTLVESRTGDLWVATAGGLNRISASGLERFTQANGLPEDFLLSLYEDEHGVLWMSSRSGGLFRRKNQTFERVDPEEVPYTLAAWCLGGDQQGRMWIGGRQGLLVLHEGRPEAWLNGSNGMTHDDVRAVCPDADGNLWVGTSFGLNVVHQGQVTTNWTSFDGRPIDTVVSLARDSSGSMWIGTLEHGLLRYRAGRLTRLTTQQGLPDNSIHQLLDDQTGHWWFSCGRGVFRILQSELDQVADGRLGQVHAELFGRESGLRSLELTSTLQPAGARTRDGRLWWPSNRGLAIVNPSRLPRNEHPPRPLIESIVVEHPGPPDKVRLRSRDRTWAVPEPGRIEWNPRRPDEKTVGRWLIREPGGGVEIPPGADRLEFQFTAPSYLAPDRVRFRSRLIGYDRGWNDDGSRRTAYYSRVPPGRYTFQVEAINEDGVPGTAAATLDLTLVPAWWQTRWLWLVGMAGLGAGTFGYWRRRSLRFSQERDQQDLLARRLIESQETERRRLAAELHDSLTQTLLVVKNRAWMGQNSEGVPDRVSRQLREIAAAAGQALDEVRALSHALRPPELDRLGLTRAFVVLGERLAESSGTRVDFHVDGVDGLLQPGQEINLFRIAQEAINNALKHGKAKRIELRLTRAQNRLLLVVEDDGRGFNPQSVPAGLGLGSMAERARILHGALTITSQPGQGSRVEASVPLPAQNP
jgi:signal transduction histidine kinase/ligand-binding sensor domain-containing protein